MSDKKNNVNEEENKDSPILTPEEIENLDLNSQKVKNLIKKFEKETSKYAVWRGNVTEAFRKWLRKEKIYHREKERISLYVSEETKNRWADFIIENKEEFPTFSKLIRQSVKFFIEDQKKGRRNSSKLIQKTISEISHALKEPLTSIKGYSQFLFENDSYKNELSRDVMENLNSILEQSILLENRITSILDKIKIHNQEYDILIIEDDLPTIRLFTNYFERKGQTCKGVVSGKKGLEEIAKKPPKLVLIDVILPDYSGYDICKLIKSNNKFRNIPVYLLTFADSKIERYLEDCRADGYLLKTLDLFDDDDEDRFPYPYIFKPPEPPGDLGVETQLQVNKFMDKVPENENVCQYCGRILTREELFSHNCRKISE